MARESSIVKTKREPNYVDETGLGVDELNRLSQLTDTMGDRITQAMEDHDISIAWLARSMGVVDRTVSDWRKDGNVSTHRIPLLAHFLGLDAGYLLTGSVPDEFQQRSSIAEVVQFERAVNRNVDDGTIKSTITRHVPLFEVHEIAELNAENPNSFLASLPSWVDAPETRGAIVVSLNPESLHLPGIPNFALQCLVDDLQGFNYGDSIGFAADLIPAEGSYALFTHRPKEGNCLWQVTPGFFSVPGSLCFNVDPSASFDDLQDFFIKVHPTDTRTADIHIDNHREWQLIGTATLCSRWLEPVQRDAQTAARKRVKSRYETRLNKRVATWEVGAFGC